MKKLLETGGFVLAAAGAGGIVHHFAERFRLWAVLRHVPFLDGSALLAANIALVVLGAALMIASDSVKEPTADSATDSATNSVEKPAA